MFVGCALGVCYRWVVWWFCVICDVLDCGLLVFWFSGFLWFDDWFCVGLVDAVNIAFYWFDSLSWLSYWFWDVCRLVILGQVVRWWAG